jgi:hypothetical protein
MSESPDFCGNKDEITGHRHRGRDKGLLYDLERGVTSFFGGEGVNIVAYLTYFSFVVFVGKCALFIQMNCTKNNK